MAVICDARGRRVTLAPRSLVGRSTDCHIRIDDRRVSAEHAVLSWSGKSWRVRDLGSRNGTLIDGERLAPGARRSLPSGARLSFANVEWALVNAAAPAARAVCVDTDQVAADDGEGVIVVATSPLVAVVSVGRGWMLEAPGGATRPVKDQDEISIGSRRWVLELPPVSDVPTESTEHARALSLDEVVIRFRVSRDGEHVSVALCSPALGVVELPQRAHQHVLLVLARARLSDSRAGGPPGEAGWLYTDDLQRALKMDRTRINLELHRARKLLDRQGVHGSERLIERRQDAQQLRMGVAALEVVDA